MKPRLNSKVCLLSKHKSRCVPASAGRSWLKARVCCSPHFNLAALASSLQSLRVAYTVPGLACAQQNNSQRCRPVAQTRQPTTTTTATVAAADERNDNEAARDAAATALWTRCLEHAGTSPRDQKIPTHVAVLKDIHGADYSTLLKCPLDDRTEHPYGQKGERKLAATGVLARCRIEFFASDYTGLFRQGTRTPGFDSVFDGGRWCRRRARARFSAGQGQAQ